MNYTVTWVPEEKADMKALLEQHQRAFPGNTLSTVKGYVKVSVPDGEPQDKAAIDTQAARIEWAKRPDVPLGDR